MATFVLVPGAWHGSWCWERLTPLLEAAGHGVAAPDLLGMGRDRTPLSTMSLARWADQIADLIRNQPEPVHLVGHSRGGAVISEAAERAPERIARLIYLTAVLLPDGRSMANLTGDVVISDENPMFELHSNGAFSLAASMVGPVFYNTTPPEWIERAKQHLTPEPMVVTTTPLRLSEARFGAVPRAYIECALDNILPLALQRAMQAVLPCDPVMTLQTDHSPFYSDPTALAESLMAIARFGRA